MLICNSLKKHSKRTLKIQKTSAIKLIYYKRKFFYHSQIEKFTYNHKNYYMQGKSAITINVFGKYFIIICVHILYMRGSEHTNITAYYEHRILKLFKHMKYLHSKTYILYMQAQTNQESRM